MSRAQFQPDGSLLREAMMPSTHVREPNFDLIARPYRWLEYLTLGKALEECRAHFLPQLDDCRRALVLGDGDGRFLAQLLAHNPHLEVDAVDTSATMLELLRQRCEAADLDADTRLCTHHSNALTFPLARRYDLVVTHFFLDCFTQADLDVLVTRVASTLTPGALWLVSDFRIPNGLIRIPARVFIRSLYLAFRVLTGLRTTHLPDHIAALTRCGLVRVAYRHSLAGVLTTELWRV
jgi:SAM-dependent methyltransferase